MLSCDFITKIPRNSQVEGQLHRVNTPGQLTWSTPAIGPVLRLSFLTETSRASIVVLILRRSRI